MTKENPAININVKTNFIEAQSDPDQQRYVFSYTITITNESASTAQLLSRHWIITDSNNKVQEVRGEGVIGEQPFLKPGESFEYTSGTLLETPVGSMHGSYQMLGEQGQNFEAPIAPFRLAVPKVLH